MTASGDRDLIGLIDAALDRPAAERLAFLERSCAGDAEMLARARSLLEVASEPVGQGLGGRIESMIGAAATSVVAERKPYPDRIGPYTILGVLGEGGMGLVLEAQQHEPVRRDVAVKLIRAGAHAPRIVARFHAERQTLASLVHPNIAKLYDAGRTDDGLPYFAMELIRGKPITRYCDDHRLPLDARIRLFRTLLGAVQHAHQKTIVHRDLKPSNVLVADVGDRPVLKVIDFGIARVASPETGMTRLTGFGGEIGTLEYMSPEQLLQQAPGADTRADVYSLGVMLYELVSGRLPFEADKLRQASPSERERMLLHTSVPRASRRTTEDLRQDGQRARRRAADARTLGSRIKGDLDTIIEVAMARDPSGRYETVARFDEDLERFLDERPITARPRTLQYRARKFVARNRYAVAASALAFSAIAAMGVVFTVRLADERDRAALEAEKARQVATFLESMFEASDPYAEEGDWTARELLDAGAVRIEAELTGQPEVQSALFGVIGRTYAGLGLWDESEAYLTRAVELDATVNGPRTAEAAALLRALGNMAADAGRQELAERALSQAVELSTDLFGSDDPATATALAGLSQLRRSEGDYAAAESLARRAVDALNEHPGRDSLDLATALHALGFALGSQATYEEAERHYREALDIRMRLLDPTHPLTLGTMMNLALIVERRGMYAEAETLLRAVLEGRRERLGMDHPLSLNALNNLAYMMWRTGQYPRATELFEEAVAVGERINPADNPTLAITLNNLAVAKHRAGAYEEAERISRRALAMDERLYGRTHPRVAGDMANLGRTLVELGRLEDADSLHVAAVAILEDLVGMDHPDRADALSALAATRLRMGHLDEAVEILEETLRIRSAAFGPNAPRTAQSLHDLGAAHVERAAWPDAEIRLREALRVRRDVLGGDHPDVAATLFQLGRVLRETSRTAEARTALQEAWNIVEARLGPSDLQRQRVERALQELLKSTGTSP